MGGVGAAPPLPDWETELNFGRRGLCQSRAQGARSSRGRCLQHPLVGGGSPAAAGCQWSPPAKPKGSQGWGAIPSSSYPLTVALVLPAWESPGLIRAFLGVAHGAGASSVTLDGACSPITLLGTDPWPGPWGQVLGWSPGFLRVRFLVSLLLWSCSCGSGCGSQCCCRKAVSASMWMAEAEETADGSWVLDWVGQLLREA